MNGYEITATAIRQAMSKGRMPENQGKQELRVFDFLASCSQQDIFTLFDSGAFNEIVKGYFYQSLRNSDVDDETTHRVLREFNDLLDFKQASDVV